MFPLISLAYNLKEQFFAFYVAELINEVYKLYQNCFANVPKKLVTYFRVLIKTINKCKDEIFDYLFHQQKGLYKILESFNLNDKSCLP